MPATISVKRGDYVRVSFKVKDWSPELLQALDDANPGIAQSCSHVLARFYSTTTLSPLWSIGLFALKRVDAPGQTLTWTVRIPANPENFVPGTYSIRADYVPESGSGALNFFTVLDQTLLDIQ